MTGLIHQAMDLQRQGRLAEAESIYLQLLRDTPDHVDALHEFGVLRMRQGRRDEAIELVKRALALAPRNAVAWNNLANMLLGVDAKAAESAYANATEMKPGFTEAWYNLGNFFRDQRRPHDALRCYRRVLELKPRFGGAYESIARFATGRSDIAGDAYRAWLESEPDNPVARHMFAAHSGQAAPARADDAYVVNIFDSAAENFDTVLARLDYAVPRLLAAALAKVLPAAERELLVLDAGCGTGLCGPLLRPAARTLIGVDLSPAMLVKARERGVYDELHAAELVGFMRAHPASYDLVICADTLVYFGALDEAMSAAAGALRPAGVLAFSVEGSPAGATQEFRLHESGRYSHDERYVRACLEAASFDVRHFEPCVLRKESGTDVHGYIVIAGIRSPT